MAKAEVTKETITGIQQPPNQPCRSSSPSQLRNKDMPSYERDRNVAGDVRPKSEPAAKKKLRLLQMLLQQKNTQVSTVVVGMLIITFLVAVSVTCIVLGGVYDNTDLYIVGGIFVLGLVVFGIMFIVVNCRPWIKNRKIHAMLDKHAEEMERRPSVTREPDITEEDLSTLRLQLNT